MHYVHKIAVDVTFTQMTAKKGIKRHGEQAVSAMYKDNSQLDDMKVMGVTGPGQPQKITKKGGLHTIN